MRPKTIILLLMFIMPIQAHDDHEHLGSTFPKSEIQYLIRVGDVISLGKLISESPELVNTRIRMNHEKFGYPLHLSAQTGQLGITKLLVESNANLDAHDSNGDTALDYVLRQKYRRRSDDYNEIIELLVNGGTVLTLSNALALGNHEKSHEIISHSWEVGDEKTMNLFDGETLNGWRSLTGGWVANDDALVAPSSDKIKYIVSEKLISEPFKIYWDIQFIDRKRNDGKVLGVLDSAGNYAWVCFDDQAPHTIQLASGRKFFDSQGFHGPWTPKEMVDMLAPMGKWYSVECDVDGSFFSVSCNGKNLKTSFTPIFPVFIWLEVQRSGARFKNIHVSTMVQEWGRN